MRHTIIALFDEVDRARQAAAALKSQGYADSSVHVTLEGQAPEGEQVPPAAQIESGPLTGLLQRLAALFGVEETQLAHYEEAVRRGGTVVQVDAADEAQAAAARDQLLAMGAANIDDRIGQWQRDGGHAAAATAGGGDGAHRQDLSVGGVRVYRHPPGRPD